MKTINFYWKPITEIPIEHWNKNDAISPIYLVRCREKDGRSILGYSYYSFVSNKWMECFESTSHGIYKVTEWTDIKI